MDVILETVQHLLDPDWIMQNGGLYLVILILFIETGVFFWFFSAWRSIIICFRDGYCDCR